MIHRKIEGQQLSLGLNWGYSKRNYAGLFIVIPYWLFSKREYEDTSSLNILFGRRLAVLYIAAYIKFKGWVPHFRIATDKQSVGQTSTVKARWEDVNVVCDLTGIHYKARRKIA